ncbi:hypothetical protein F5Y13DRAFT_189996 [Hypoxylon sp. FL1857]|nr:hypothetical protein F5Y13DRAFT_189996 [Hypoxylon sp. FL1857]
MWFSGSCYAQVAIHTEPEKGTDKAALEYPSMWHTFGEEGKRSWGEITDPAVTAKAGNWRAMFEDGRGIKLLLRLMDCIKKFIREYKEQYGEEEMVSCRFILRHMKMNDGEISIAVQSDDVTPVKLVSDEMASKLCEDN